MAYLNGGDLAGSQRGHRGARDQTPPQDSRPYEFDNKHCLYFAGESTRWTGGVCFLGPRAASKRDAAPNRSVLGRAWLINGAQLIDVWSQESLSASAELEDAVSDRGFAADQIGDVLDVGSRWYNRLEVVGDLDGIPAFTITAAAIPALNLASEPYLNVVADGLSETWELGAEETATYLAAFNRV